MDPPGRCEEGPVEAATALMSMMMMMIIIIIIIMIKVMIMIWMDDGDGSGSGDDHDDVWDTGCSDEDADGKHAEIDGGRDGGGHRRGRG